MDFIKELYNGNISPWDQQVVKNSEYEKLARSTIVIGEEIMQKLDEETVKRFKQLVDAEGDLNSLTAEENYVFGFRDGARLMLDILTGGSKNLFY